MERGWSLYFFHTDVELGKKSNQSLLRGGARLMEFHQQRGDFAFFEVFGALNKYVLAESGMI
jgi:hypothetical protein